MKKKKTVGTDKEAPHWGPGAFLSYFLFYLAFPMHIKRNLSILAFTLIWDLLRRHLTGFKTIISSKGKFALAGTENSWLYKTLSMEFWKQATLLYS